MSAKEFCLIPFIIISIVSFGWGNVYAFLYIESNVFLLVSLVIFLILLSNPHLSILYGACELHLDIEAIRSHGRVWKYKGTAKVNGKRMADAEWSATIVDKKNDT